MTTLDARIRYHVRTDVYSTENVETHHTAILAVLNLHSADEHGNCAPCNVATYGVPLAAPCPTVRAIATELDITEEEQQS